MLGGHVNRSRQPYVSVIIPVHNKRGYVTKCINSVLLQSFEDFELLIVDDASSDGSWDEVQGIVDSRIRHLFRTRPGPGGYAARNLGIQKARGRWIAFLDADDEWLAGHLEKVLAAERLRPDVKLVTAGWYSATADGGRALDPYSRMHRIQGVHEVTLTGYLNGPSPVNADVGIVRSELVRAIGGFEEVWSHGADLQFWLKVLVAKNGPALWFPTPSAIYNQDAPNMVTAKRFQTRSPSTVYIRKILAEKDYGPEVTSEQALKRYANRSALRPFLRKARQSELKIADVTQNFYLRALRIDQAVVLFSLPLMPHRLRSFFVRRGLKKYL